MDRIVECVTNFSEGRDRVIVQALIEAVTSTPGVKLLDQTSDPDHHRSVLTFCGSPEGVVEAAYRAITVATERIDLRRHEGVHPRVGATDVVPFVPIRGVTMRDCVRLAKQLGAQVGRELGIPVFLYELAAVQTHRAPLEVIRHGGLAGLASRMESDADWQPDFGPSRLHPRAGAIVIGARPPLIAFNVNLRSRDVGLARAIAKTVRQSSGGIPHLKAIGVALPSRGLVQVAMNLTDYRVTPMHAAFEAVQAQAALRGVAVAGSELIGLVPQAALAETAADALQLEGFDQEHLLEARIETALAGTRESSSGRAADIRQWSVPQLLEAIADTTAGPAGASVSALVGAMAASLGIMGARLGHRQAIGRRLSAQAKRLVELAQMDGEAYRRYQEAAEMARGNPARTRERSSALHRATEIPLEMAERVVQVWRDLSRCLGPAKPRVQSDLLAALTLALAAGEAALSTAQENMRIQQDPRLKAAIHRRIQWTRKRLEELRALCYTPPPNQSGSGATTKQARPGKVRRQREWKSKSSTTTSKKHSKLRRKSSRAKGSSGN